MLGFGKERLWPRLFAACVIAAVGWLVLQIGVDWRHADLSHLRSVSTGELLLVFVGALLGFVLVSVPLLAGTFCGLAVIALTIIISRATRPESGIWFGWIVLFAQIASALAWKACSSGARARREKRVLLNALGNYFSADRAERFTTMRYRKLFEPGTERRELSILFSDHPKLNECAHASAGAVVKDEHGRSVAIWNAPELQKDHASLACKTALRLARRDGCVGLHTGVATIGNVGTAEQINYTVAGDSVEIAARLAALNRTLGTRVLLTMESRRGMSDSFVTRYMGNFRFAEGADSVSVYELMGGDDVDEMRRSLRDSFEQAVYAFQGSDREDARSSFERVLQVYPDDLATKFYLQRIEALSGEPWPYDWSGTIDVLS